MDPKHSIIKRQNKNMCVSVYIKFKKGMVSKKYFILLKGLYMGRLGNNMAKLGNPLKMKIKCFKILGSGAKNLAQSSNLKHTTFYFRTEG